VYPTAKDLVLKLLVVDPVRRLSAAQVQLHPWVVRVRLVNHYHRPVVAEMCCDAV
jgi:serine/threonine protein kinase